MKIKLLLITLFVVMLSFVVVGCDTANHKLVHFDANAPTCVNDGNIEFYFCYHCGKAYSDEAGQNEITTESVYLKATGEHNYTDYVVTSVATESTKGEETRYCKVCGKVDAKEIPVLEHTHILIKHAAVKSTCTVNGSVEYYQCTKCQETFSDKDGKNVLADTTPPLAAHDLVETAKVEATCEKGGNAAYYTCKTCATVFADKDAKNVTTVEACKTQAVAHKGVKHDAVAPTCFKNGTAEYYECSACKALFADSACTDKIYAVPVVTTTGHNPTFVAAKSATCGVKGNVAYYYCDICKKAYSDAQLTKELATVETQALSHSLTHHDAIETTCKTDGQVEYYECSNCKVLFADEKATKVLTKEELVVKTTGHALTHHEAVVGDCQTKAVKEYWSCDVCKKVYADKDAANLTTVALLTGTYGDHVVEHHEAKEVECGIDGNVEYWSCKACEKIATNAQLTEVATLEEVTIKAEPHKLLTIDEVPAQCEKSGVAKYYQCSVCKKEYMDADAKVDATVNSKIIKAKGHEVQAVEYVAPTLEKAGNIDYYVCKNCPKLFADAKASKQITDVEVPVLTDEIWSMVTITPTLAVGGYDLYRAEGQKDVKINFTNKVENPFKDSEYKIYDLQDTGSGTLTFYGWTSAHLTLNSDGVGFGSAFPVRGCTEITVLNAATGQVRIRVYTLKNATKAQAEQAMKDGKYVATSTYTTIDTTWDFEEEVQVTAYYTVDFNYYSDYNGYLCADGTFIRTYNATDNTLVHPIVYTFDTQTSSTLKGSAWEACVAFEMVKDGKVSYVFIENEVVYFNVTFADAKLAKVNAVDAKNQQYLNVLDEAGNVITAYVNNGKTLVKVDGYQGTYTNRFGDMVLDGCGNVVFQGKVGTYDLEQMIVIADGMTYDIVLDQEKMTYEYNQKLVKVTYHIGFSAYAAMVPYSLVYKFDVLDNTKTKKFMGWCTDNAFENYVVLEEDGTYIPLVDIELFAKWADRVDLTLVNVKPGEESTFVYGCGEYLVEAKLPYYGTEKIWLEEWKVFRGWFLDPEFNESIPAEAEITSEYVGEGITLYGKWEDLPDYYGTYKGTNTFGGPTKTETLRYTITIDEDGNIKGRYTAKVTGYDEKTGIITIGSESILFNKEAGVIVTYCDKLKAATNYSDVDMYCRNTTAVVKDVSFKYNPTTTANNYQSRIVEFTVPTGNVVVAYVGGKLTKVATLTDSLGKTVTVTDVATTSKGIRTLVAKDSNGNEILAIGDKNYVLCNSSSTPIALDGIQGMYNGLEQIGIDGIGNFYMHGFSYGRYFQYGGIWYRVLDASPSWLECYSFSINDNIYSEQEAKCTIEYNEGSGAEDKDYLYFIEYTLPTLDDTTTKVFRGWVDQDGNEIEDGKFTLLPGATDNVTKVSAVWKDIAKLTINYNDGTTENSVVNYAIGETATVERPVYAKHAFVKWLDDNSVEWTSGTEMTGDVTITAQWEDAPIYNQTYQVVIVQAKEANGGLLTYDDRSCNIDIDPYGVCEKITSWPYSGMKMEITKTGGNASLKLLSITFSKGSQSNTYKAYCFDNTGLIMLSNSSTKTDLGTEFILLVPETASIVVKDKRREGSYTANANQICFSYTLGSFTQVYIYDKINNETFTNTNSIASPKIYSIFDLDKTLTANDFYNADSFCIQTSAMTIKCFAYDEETKEMKTVNNDYCNKFIPASGTDYIIFNGLNKVLVNLAGITTGPTYGKAYLHDTNKVTFIVDTVGGKVSYEASLDTKTMTYTIAEVDTSLEIIITEDVKNSGYYSRYWDLNIESILKTVNEELERAEIEKVAIGLTSSLFEGTKSSGIVNLGNNEKVEFTAVLVDKVKLTVHFEDGDKDFYFGKGQNITFDYPTDVVNGKLITGWTYNDEAYTFGTIEEDMEITPVYLTCHALYGKYYGGEIYGSPTIYVSNSKKVFINTSGKIETGASVASNCQISYNETTGAYYLAGRQMCYDLENSVLVIDDYANKQSLSNDYHVLIKGYEKASIDKTKSSQKNSGYTRFILVQLNDTTTMNVFVHEGKVYGNVTFTDDVTTATAGGKTGFSVKDSNGNIVATF